jgi:hypothetical protein
MKSLQAVVVVLATSISAMAMATPCDQVQAGIDAKIKARGVTSYSLEAIPAGEVKDQKVVGGCEGGSKKIVYTHTASAKTAAKPAAGAEQQTANAASK